MVLPEDICARLNLKPGDMLDIVETAEGIELTKDYHFSETMRVARKVMDDNREVLRRLADS